MVVLSASLAAACSSADDGGQQGEAGSGGSSGDAGSGGTWPGGSGGSAGSPACSGTTPGSALVFDGVDDHVTMGAAAELGLAELMIEAWVRRDGSGQTMGTGVGGLS